MKTLILSLAIVAVPWSNFLNTDSTKILITYYSQAGHTEAMARAVAEGARSVPDVEIVLKSVTDASTEDVVSADAIIIGSPVYNANVAPPVQEFINSWPFKNAPLQNKIGAAFVTAGGISAGEEIVQMNIIHSMLVFGMIVVGGPTWRQAFGASAVVEEKPFLQAEGQSAVSEQFIEKGRALGQCVATIAKKWKSVR